MAAPSLGGAARATVPALPTQATPGAREDPHKGAAPKALIVAFGAIARQHGLFPEAAAQSSCQESSEPKPQQPEHTQGFVVLWSHSRASLHGHRPSALNIERGRSMRVVLTGVDSRSVHVAPQVCLQLHVGESDLWRARHGIQGWLARIAVQICCLHIGAPTPCLSDILSACNHCD